MLHVGVARVLQVGCMGTHSKSMMVGHWCPQGSNFTALAAKFAACARQKCKLSAGASRRRD